MFIVTPVNSVRTLKSPPPQLIFRKVPATACWQARYNACCKQFLLTRCDIFTQVPSAPAINQNTILPEMTIFWNRLDLISIGHCNAVLYITSWTPSVAMPTIDGVNNTSGQRNRSLPMATVWPSGILNKDRERKSYLNVRLQQHVVTRLLWSRYQDVFALLVWQVWNKLLSPCYKVDDGTRLATSCSNETNTG